MKITTFSKLTLALLSTLTPLMAYDISNAIKETTPLKTLKNSETPSTLSISKEEEKPLELAEGEKIRIISFQLLGVDALEDSLFDSTLESYRNKDLSLKQMNELASKITHICQAQGYLLAKAYIPKQDATKEGMLSIQVLIGTVGTLSSTNHSLVKDSFIQSTLEHTLPKGTPITQSSLERSMLLISDIPGASLPQVSITSGKTYGSSDFSFATQESSRWSGYIIGDNYGSKYAGRDKVSLGLGVNSPLGLGDKLFLSASESEAAALQNAKIDYSFPLYSNGLRAELSLARTTYELGDDYADLDAKGYATIYEGVISYPILRTQQESYTLGLRMTHKDMRDEIGSTDTNIPKKINVASLELNREAYGTLFGLSSYITMLGTLSYGHLDINDDIQKALNEAGANTTGNYSKALISLSDSLALSNAFSLVGSLKAQQALGHKNLDTSEQLTISGVDGVKVYPDSELSSDNGYVLGLELKYAIPTYKNINQIAGIFFDTGKGWVDHGDYINPTSKRLNDMGLSYTLGYKNFFAKAQLATIIGDEKVTAESSYDTRFLLQAGASF